MSQSVAKDNARVDTVLYAAQGGEAVAEVQGDGNQVHILMVFPFGCWLLAACVYEPSAASCHPVLYKISPCRPALQTVSRVVVVVGNLAASGTSNTTHPSPVQSRPINDTDNWDAAPSCSGSPNATNCVADRQGRL